MSSRTRTRNLTLPIFRQSKNYGSSWNLLNTTGGTYNHTGLTESMSDSTTPGFFSKKRRGQFLPVNSMTHTTYQKVVGTSTTAQWKLWADWNPLVLMGYRENSGELGLGRLWALTSSSFPAWVGSVPSVDSDAALLTSALASARTQGFDLLTFLAEMNKTIELVRRAHTRTLDRANRVAASLLSKKSLPSKFKDSASAFAETWLEGRFGWRILAYDLDAMNQSLNRLRDMHSSITRGYASSSATSSRYIEYSTTNTGKVIRHTPSDGGSQVLGTSVITQNRTITKRGGVLLEALVSDFVNVDPLVTAYEVIPFSWILDYFSNLGDVVAAWSPFASESLLGGWISLKDETTTVSTFTAGGSTKTLYGGYYMQIHSGGGNAATTTTNKVVFSRTPQSPSVGLSFNLNLSWSKITDLVAVGIASRTKILGSLFKHYRV